MSQPYQRSQSSPPNSGLAIGSLVASILGLTALPTIGSIVGLVLGYMARRRIEESMGRLGGDGMARAGIIIGWIGIGLTVLGICLALFIIIFVSGGLGLFWTGFGQ